MLHMEVAKALRVAKPRLAWIQNPPGNAGWSWLSIKISSMDEKYRGGQRMTGMDGLFIYSI